MKVIKHGVSELKYAECDTFIPDRFIVSVCVINVLQSSHKNGGIFIPNVFPYFCVVSSHIFSIRSILKIWQHATDSMFQAAVVQDITSNGR
jgi:hypothetical protein